MLSVRCLYPIFNTVSVSYTGDGRAVVVDQRAMGGRDQRQRHPLIHKIIHMGDYGGNLGDCGGQGVLRVKFASNIENARYEDVRHDCECSTYLHILRVCGTAAGDGRAIVVDQRAMGGNMKAISSVTKKNI